MAFLDADVGERFFVFRREYPGIILAAVKVLDVDEDSKTIRVKVFKDGRAYEKIFGNNEEMSIGLPRKCNVGGAFTRTRGMALLIAADLDYAIVRENLYAKRSMSIDSNPTVIGFGNTNPFELRYSEVKPNSSYISRTNLRDLRKGPLEVLAESKLMV